MFNTQHPASILRLAWTRVRLDALRSVTGAAIEHLERLSPEEVLGRAPSRQESQFDIDPTRAALEDCCEELREESGMPLFIGRQERVWLKVPSDPRWKESYANALDRYRTLAGAQLLASLSRL